MLINCVQETGPFDKELIALLPPSLKYVCHNGAGYDNVDVDALTQKGMSAGTIPSSSVPLLTDRRHSHVKHTNCSG